MRPGEGERLPRVLRPREELRLHSEAARDGRAYGCWEQPAYVWHVEVRSGVVCKQPVWGGTFWRMMSLAQEHASHVLDPTQNTL